MTTMESLIGLVNRIQQACTKLGDYGGSDSNSTFSSLLIATSLGSSSFRRRRRWSGTVASRTFQILNFILFYAILVYFLFYFIFGDENRVQGNLRFWRVSLDVTFYLEDQVLFLFPFSFLRFFVFLFF
jgi:hypothetical protein